MQKKTEKNLYFFLFFIQVQKIASKTNTKDCFNLLFLIPKQIEMNPRKILSCAS
jgi:hypothetical protein